MNYNDKIGKIVLNLKNEKGTIVEVSDYIKVDFDSKTAQFQLDAFIKGFLRFLDTAYQNEVLTEMKEAEEESIRLAELKGIEQEKAAIEKEKKAEEKASKASMRKTKKTVIIDNLFGADYHVEHLLRTSILSYQEVERQFGIKISGFGRGINITNDAVVLISSMAKKGGRFMYHDHWTKDGDYIYSGEGKTGDQTLTRGNKAVVDAAKDGKTIYLLVKLSPSEYYFQGPVVLVDHAYEDDQDENGKVRKEYKFTLRKINEKEDRNYDDGDLLDKHLYLEWDRGFHSFDIIDKHESHFVIHDRNCKITYSANRVKCETVSKRISDANYGRLIRLFTRYKSILSTESTPSFIKFPFGGVFSFKYDFDGKSNYTGPASLFKGSNKGLTRQVYQEYNEIMSDIFKQ